MAIGKRSVRWFRFSLTVVAFTLLASSVVVAQVDTGAVGANPSDDVLSEDFPGLPPDDFVDGPLLPGVGDPRSVELPPADQIGDPGQPFEPAPPGGDPGEPVVEDVLPDVRSGPVEVTPIVVDDPLPDLPVWSPNPELSREGVTPGVVDVTIGRGAGEARGAGSVVSFEPRGKALFAQDVALKVRTFDPSVAKDVSAFRTLFEFADPGVGKDAALTESVDVVFDYSDIPILAGGDAFGRLNITLFEDCVADKRTGAQSCSKSTPLETVNDVSLRSLRAELTPELLKTLLAGATVAKVSGAEVTSGAATTAAGLLSSGSGGALLGMSSGSSSGEGDFAAAPFQTIADWDVSGFTGSASTSYPIQLPAPAVGPQPSIVLSYSSSAIDGMNVFSNNQVGSIGAGWSYTPGYITRALKSCPSTGDLCTAGDEYSIVLNGVSSRLIRDSGASFRVQDDPNWRVSRLTAPGGNPDQNDKYWEVTAKDGTRYVFGLSADSAQTIPLNGSADSVYQWDLNKIIDTVGNEAVFTYGQEFNYYGTGKKYVQASNLRQIDYSILSGQPSLRVRFNQEARCGDASTTFGNCDPAAGDYTDTPTDLWCPLGTGCSETSPTFWTNLRLGSIQVLTLKDTNGDKWRTLALYDLAQFAPDEFWVGDGGQVSVEPRTLLYRVHRRPEGDYKFNAYQQLEAENYTFTGSNITTPESKDYGGGDAVAWASDTHISLHDTNFSNGVSQVIVRVASVSGGQTIKIREGSLTGTVLATITVPATGSLNAYQTKAVTMTSISGVKKLFLDFNGSSEARINWVRFIPVIDGGTGNPQVQPSLPAVDYFNSNFQYLQNRKNVVGGLSPVYVARIGTIRNQLGGKTTFTYGTPKGCDEVTGQPGEPLPHWRLNVKNCFPVQAPSGPWITFWKYVVTKAEVYDPVANTTGTYTYTYGTPRWAKNVSQGASACDTTWNVFRGHAWSQVEGPNGFKTKTWFYQGMRDDVETVDPVTCGVTVRTPGVTPAQDPADATMIELSDGSTKDDFYWLVGRPADSVSYEVDGTTSMGRTETEYVSGALTAGSGPRDSARFTGVYRVKSDTTYSGTTKERWVTYTYDQYGNVTRLYQNGEFPFGGDNRFTDTAYVVNTAKHIVDRPKSVKQFDSFGPDIEIGLTEFFYDDQGINTAPDEGLLTYQRTYISASPTDYAASSFSYLPDGRLESSTDPELNTTTTTYFGNTAVERGRVQKVTDPAGLSTMMGYDAYFRVDAVTDTRGKTVTADRDTYSRVTAVTAPTSGPASDAVRYQYTDSTPARLKTSTWVDGSFVDTYTYTDGFGRVFQTQSVSPNVGYRVIVDTSFDDAGRVLASSDPFDVTGSAGSGAVEPNYAPGAPVGERVSLWLNNIYGPRGDIIAVETRVDNQFVRDVKNDAQGWWANIATDANGFVTTTEMDAFGNVTKVTEDVGVNKFNSEFVATEYKYDAANRLIEVKDADGNVTEIEYDRLGRKKNMTDPDMGYWEYTYYKNGNLKTQTDARGVVLNWEYDALNRPTVRKEGVDPAFTTLATWSYYSSASSYAGLPQKSTSFNGSQGDVVRDLVAYDERGNLTDELVTIPGNAGGQYRTQWGYDIASNLVSLTYPGGTTGQSGETVTYGYNSLGQPDSLIGTDTYVTGAKYTEWGALEEITRPMSGPDIRQVFTYWGDRRARTITAGTDSVAENIQKFDLTDYDENGNLTKIVDWRNSGQRQCFNYDNADRLTWAFTATALICDTPDTNVGVGGYDRLFTYDAIGNMLTNGGVTGTYTYGAGSAGPHAVTSIGTGYTFQYDANGNQTKRTISGAVTDLVFNDDNRLVTSTEAGDTTSFLYDADGARVKRTTSTGDTIYVGSFERSVDQVAGGGSNLVPNPGFESGAWTEVTSSGWGDGTSIWRGTSGVAAERSGTYGYGVNNVVYGYLLSDPMNVSAGSAYEVKSWVRGMLDADDGDGTNWIIRAQFYDSNGSALSYVNVASGDASSLSSTWIEASGDVVAPSGAATMRVMLYMLNAQGWIAFDAATVKKNGTGPNKLWRGGFEASEGWTEVPSTVAGDATNFWRGNWGIGDAYAGTWSYTISNIAYGYVYSDPTPVSGGSQYVAEVAIRGKVDPDTSLSTAWLVQVYWYTSSGSYLSRSTMAAGGPTDVTTSWANEGATATSPSNASFAVMVLFFYNGSGWVAYDDAVLKPVNGSNLLLNPGFESSGGWTEVVNADLGDATSIYRSTWGFSTPKTGSYAYSITNDAYGNIRSAQFPVTAGADYDATAWIRGEVDTDDSRDGTIWIVRVRWEDLNGDFLSYSNAQVGTAAGGLPASFTQKGGTVTAPVGAVYGRAEVYFYLASGWLNVDDVSVTPTTTVNISETKYYSFGGNTVGMRVDGELSWIFSDQLGSTGITYQADGSGTVRQFYYPFGGIRNSGGAPVVDTDVGFTGQRLDTTTGLMFYQARYYDPLTARFISADTIVPDPGNPQDFNRYSYVRNNPLKYTDPSGNCARILKELENKAAGQGVSIDLGSGSDCPDSFTFSGNARNFGKGIIDTPANIGNSLIWLDDFVGSGLDDALDRYYAEADVDRPDSFWFPTLGADAGYEGEYIGGSLVGPLVWAKGFKLGGALGSRLAARFGSGTTRSVLHPTFEPGPFAGESIPASGARQSFTAAERAQINRIGQQSGCHTCGASNPGTRSGNFVPDHQPVSALNLEAVPQRLFPQCISCSRTQGLATARTLQQLRQLSGGGI